MNQATNPPASPPHPDIVKFSVIGLIVSEAYQKCKFLAEKCYQCYPQIYQSPEIRPMLDFEWEEYLDKIKRQISRGHKLWELLSKKCAVFVNDTYLGSEQEMLQMVQSKFRMFFDKDWYCLGVKDLFNYLEDIFRSYRQMVFLTVAIKGHVIGSLLFKLYNDIVPMTCEVFLNRCKKHEYVGTPIHRIVKNGWIQCGGFNLKNKTIQCENYAIPHNRRGVLSMCNDNRNSNNSTQFFVTLSPAEWMNCNYVAFGQLMHGANVLKQIENIPTTYESPKVDIKIINCGEFLLHESKSPENIEMISKYLIQSQPLTDTSPDPKDNDQFSDTLSVTKYKAGFYGLPTDNKSYGPIRMLPKDVFQYLKSFEELIEGEECCCDNCEGCPLFQKIKHNKRKVYTPVSVCTIASDLNIVSNDKN